MSYKLNVDIEALQKNFEELNTALKNLRVLGEKVGETVRLPRDRKGKTPIDVGIVEQGGLKRVRLSMGEDFQPGRRNSDLSEKETEDLITMLNYNLAVVRGEIDE